MNDETFDILRTPGWREFIDHELAHALDAFQTKTVSAFDLMEKYPSTRPYLIPTFGDTP
jgi:hypothetical protein